MKRHHLFVGATGLVLAIGATLFFWEESGSDDAALLRPEDAETVALGRMVYKENCASCHGIDLEGEPDWRTRRPDGLLPAPPHDETGHTWHHPDQVLFDITKLGLARAANLENYETAMPAYEGILTDDEIIAVLSFIKSTWPAEIRDRHDELNRISPSEQRQ
ncbi:MAG: cytochrome c [Rhodobiaceae bacterium]|jgi:mono/diheme cytochrome c family protein|nr:cytochrome c [Rhodobiaceae bacterium]